MSKYTTELRYMLETIANKTENASAHEVNGIIDLTRTNLFDFSYPSTNLTPSEKEHLEKHIMLHFYTREIGFETFGLFKLKLQSRLWDIMPKYDEYYRLNHLDLDFFNDVDYTRKLDSRTDYDGTDTKTGAIRRLNDGYDETSTTGKIISQNSGAITNVKTGSELTENGGGTTNVTTGSVTDSGTTGNTRTETGKVTDSESGQLNKVTTGGYSDTESGQVNKAITGGYSDTNSGSVLNLHNDTPQTAVDISTNPGENYVSDIQKRIDATATTRAYNQYLESTEPINHATTRLYNTLLESTQPIDYKKERTFTNYQITDSGTSGNTKTFNSVTDTYEDTQTSETTYNEVTDTQTDTKKNEQSFDNYKVRNTDTKGNTETYNNLMNTIDKTDIVDLTERIFGNVHGNNIEKLIKYRDSILNLEYLIIKDLDCLFMQLW